MEVVSDVSSFENWGGISQISKVWKKISQRVAIFHNKTFQHNLYPEVMFYVIVIGNTTSSIGAIFWHIRKELRKVDEMGAVPIVDFTKAIAPHINLKELGVVNPWEYYFEQPSRFQLSAVKHAKNVIYGKNMEVMTVKERDLMISDDNILSEDERLFRKYIYVNKRVERNVDEIQRRLFNSCDCILGVTYRGTDYRNRDATGEYRQPSLEEELELADSLSREWDCSHIFLTTEVEEVVNEFQKKFGSRLIFLPRKRYPKAVKVTQTYKFNRENDEYNKAMDYFMEIILLSRCDCLLSGKMGMLALLLPMNQGNYKHVHIIDRGVYGDDKDF